MRIEASGEILSFVSVRADGALDEQIFVSPIADRQTLVGRG